MKNIKMRHVRFVISAIIFFFFYHIVTAQTPDKFRNPILPGYHPDPSICRVGDDYYLVNSSFVWYPGIPVFHSKDLVNWDLIGHAINRPDQLDFSGLPDKLGVFAPTIRHHNGVFYIINTCVACKMNFYITATNPAGPWSDPIWLPEAEGIDPSLFWDDDGKCYYTGMKGPKKKQWKDQCVIYNQELDLEKQKLVGEEQILTYGHANNASYPEGPHLYKINGKYMLMISEGGTGMYHALTVHHSDSINGPFISNYINPVLSHRQFGENYPLQAIGHGDLVQTQNGEWWCVLLGKRRIERFTTLGRETFLAKVEFEGNTPVFNPGYGKVLNVQKRPNLPWTPVEKDPVRDDFNGTKIGLKWCTIRTPLKEFYKLENGKLSIDLRPELMDSLVNSSILLQRIVDHKFECMTKMRFNTTKVNEQAGLTIYRTNENHYKLLKSKNSLVLIKSFEGVKTEVARVPYVNKEVYLKVEGNNLDVQFSYGESKEDLKSIGGIQSLKVIADGHGNQFNGPGVGVYATSNGKKTKAFANFEWFDYQDLTE